MDDRVDGEFTLLSLGANLGRRKETIQNAVNLIVDRGLLCGLKQSSFYETEPYGIEDQPWFLNICVCGFTNLTPTELLSRLKEIEAELGRISRQRWHEREIDIDIILYSSYIIDEHNNGVNLVIPHPQMCRRRFVLVPAAEIASEAIHPIYKKTVLELLSECSDNSVVKNK